ncbi:MAG: proline hydroxylase [Streptomyces sp.]|nr:proline hydroxylase [Streptomyces sp.]
MATGSPHDPFFRAVTSSAFKREHIADLAAGRVAAVQVPDLLPRAVCGQTLRALMDAPFDSYGRRRVDPPVMRFGVGVSDHRAGGAVADGYWEALEGHRAAWSGLGLPFDPFQACRDALGAEWPAAVRPGTRGGRELAAGVAREPNQGFQVHFDDALREFTGNLLDATLVAQFAFNLYLSVPERGGQTVVWRHRWHPDDEAHRLPHSYGFAPGVVGDAESFELQPGVGQALLFDPRNYHAVRPSSGGRRIALGFSLGLTDTGELLAWA